MNRHGRGIAGRRGYVLWATLCLGVLLALGISCARDERAVARQQLAARVKSTFGISFPCSVRCARTLGNRDLGLLIGAHRDTLTWTWDAIEGRRIPPRPPNMSGAQYNALAESILGYPAHLVHVGPHGTPLPLNSPAESVFIEVLWSAIGSDSVFVPEDKDKIAVLRSREWGTTKHLVQDYIYRLNSGPRAASVARALERQRRGLPAFRTHKEATQTR
jgi:hypothetical protein